MDLKQRLHQALAITTKEFNHALEQGFESTAGNYPERMVSDYYIRAIAMALPRANVFLEVPVTGKRGSNQDHHIDALVFNDREVVVAEFKVAWAQSHWDALTRDLARLQGPVAQEIRRKFLISGDVAPGFSLEPIVGVKKSPMCGSQAAQREDGLFPLHWVRLTGTTSAFGKGKGVASMRTTLRGRCSNMTKWPPNFSCCGRAASTAPNEPSALTRRRARR